MVKRTSLYRKLASYSALATAVLVVKKSDAQIIYTALNPNVLLSGARFDSTPNYYLDLNNDGTPDFKFTASFRSGGSSTHGNGGYGRSNLISANATNQNKVDSDKADIYGNVIGTQNTWAGRQLMALHYFRKEWVGTHILFSGSGNYGNFYDENNRYLPLKLIKNGATYYGWARVSCGGADSLTIKDYAYNTIPDSSIKAGYTGCSSTPVTPVISAKTDTLLSSKAKSYQWFLSDSLLVSDTTSFITGLQGNYYSVLTTDSNGCISQSTAYYFDSCLSIKPFINNYGIDSACGNIYLTIPYPVPNSTVQWQFNGDTIAGSTGYNYYNADSTGNYSAIFTNITEGCSEVSNSIAVKIYKETPYPYIYQICDTMYTDEGAYYHIQWYDSTNTLINDTTNRYFPPPKPAYYHVSFINGLCVSSSYEFYYEPYSNQEQHIVAYNNGVLCSDEPVYLYFPRSVNDSARYQWVRNDTTIIGANQFNYYATVPGVYWLEITSGSCQDYSDSLLVTRDTTHLSLVMKNDTLFANDTSLYDYNWYVDSTYIWSANLYYYVPNQNGQYMVAAADTNSCWHQSAEYEVTWLGIHSITQQANVELFLYNKLLHINLYNASLIGSTLEIYNMLGQQVYSVTLNSMQTQINLNNLLSGIYIARIVGKDVILSRKIIIE